MKSLILVFAALVLFGCSNDETGPSLDSPRNFQVIDHGNASNSSDIRVRFLPASNSNGIEEYRIYIMDSSVPRKSLKELITSSNYVRVVTDSAYFRFKSDLLDVDGNLITNGSYNAVILSIGNNSKIYSPEIDVDFELRNAEYFEIKTLTELPGPDALTYNKVTERLHVTADTDVFEVEPATGSFSSWLVNVDGDNGGLGGAFNSNYTKFYLSFFSTNRVGEYDMQSETWKIIAEDINGPTGTAVDQEGNVFVASYYDQTIFRISPEGTKSVYSTGTVLQSVGSIVLVEDDLFAINFEQPTIAKIDSEGRAELFCTLPFNGVRTGYLTHGGGYFYTGSDTRMFRIDEQGNSDVIFGGNSILYRDGPAPFASSSGLTKGFASSITGDTIYFADQNNIRMLIVHDALPEVGVRE